MLRAQKMAADTAVESGEQDVAITLNVRFLLK